MSDMLAAIAPKSDQINAEDLLSGDMTIKITGVQVRAGTEQPVSISFEGSSKVFRPCKTVSRIIVAAWGPDTSTYVGRMMTLYRDPSVTWGGLAVGGIRVRAISHIDQPLRLALAESKKSRKITEVQPLRLEQAQQLTLDQARYDLDAAKDLDDLRTIWSRKSMAPFRDQLQSRLDELKGELTGGKQGRADEDHGDQHDGDDA